MIGALIGKKIFQAIPWKELFAFIAIGLVIFSVFLYVKNAEENRTKVGTLETRNAELVDANAALEAAYKKQILVLQEAVADEREREKDYGENIKIIREGPDGECARHSPAISKSLRLRRERASGH